MVSGKAMSDWHEPKGAVTTAQLNRMLAECQLPPPEELPPEHAALWRMHVAERKHAALQHDPMYDRVAEEVQRRLTEDGMKNLDIARLRDVMVSTMQHMLWDPAKGQWFPETWEDVRNRGAQSAEEFGQVLVKQVKLSEPMATALANGYESVWQRLSHDAYRHAERSKAHASTVAPAMTARELNAMLTIAAADYLPIVGDRMGPVLAQLPDPAMRQFVTQELASFMSDYMQGILLDVERKGAYPESWKEFDARARGGERGLVEFICERANIVNISLQGLEEEITAIYRDVVRLHKTAAQQMTVPQQRYLQ